MMPTTVRHWIIEHAMHVPLCNIQELPDPSSKSLTTPEGVELFAVHKNGQLYLYVNSCPHLGIGLNWEEDQFLDIDNTLIQCATHGALFQVEDGECVAGPCVGRALEAVPFHIEDGQLCVDAAVLADL